MMMRMMMMMTIIVLEIVTSLRSVIYSYRQQFMVVNQVNPSIISD